MKAAQINRYGGNEVVEINSDTTKPMLSVGQVLIETYAAGVNPVDWKIREGYLQQMVTLKFPVTLGGDFSGVVIELGPGVTGFKKGDEVYGTASVLGMGSGSFAEFIGVDVKFISKKPKIMNNIEAAAMPLAGVSALQALTEHIDLKRNQKILIHGGAGGIGSIAIQIAKHQGTHVATTVSTKDTQFVKTFGPDKVIDYKTQRFEELLSDYDAVFDTVGGDTYKKSFTVLKKSGIIVSMLEQPNTDFMKKYEVRAIAQMTHVDHEQLSQLAKLIDQGIVKVHIDKIFSLKQASEALVYLQKGHSRGKVVLKIKENI